jgi:hypothetical protein
MDRSCLVTAGHSPCIITNPKKKRFLSLMVNGGDAWIRLTALALGLTLTRVHVRLMRTAADLRLRTVLPDQRQSLPPSLAIHLHRRPRLPLLTYHLNYQLLLLLLRLLRLLHAPSNTVQQALIPQQHYL